VTVLLFSKWDLQHYVRGLTKLHAGSEQPLVCVVINNTLPTRQKPQHSLSCIWEILNAGLRVSKLSFEILLAESYLLHVSRVVRCPVFHGPCRYFTVNLAEADKRQVLWKSVSEASGLKIICRKKELTQNFSNCNDSGSESCHDRAFSEVY